MICCNWKTRLLLIAGLALLWWWLRQTGQDEPEGATQTENKLPKAVYRKPAVQRATTPSTRLQQHRTPAPDDLTLIKGIGPKIASVLNAAGITTYSELYETGVAQVGEILDAADIRPAQPETWMEQARLAAGGDFELLKEYQSQSKA